MSDDSGHPVVAALLDVAMRGFARQRARLLPHARGRVLEVGLGTGLNLPHYGAIDALVAVEPDPHMRRRARPRIAAAPFHVELLDGSAEAIPCEDAAFDTVVCTWVLCSVADPDAAAAELRRVLRPHGRLLFAEHTRSRFGPQAAAQRALTPCWRHLAGGCHLDRDSLATLRAAGFDLDVAPTRRDRWTLAPSYRGVGTPS